MECIISVCVVSALVICCNICFNTSLWYLYWLGRAVASGPLAIPKVSLHNKSLDRFGQPVYSFGLANHFVGSIGPAISAEARGLLWVATHAMAYISSCFFRNFGHSIPLDPQVHPYLSILYTYTMSLLCQMLTYLCRAYWLLCFQVVPFQGHSCGTGGAMEEVLMVYLGSRSLVLLFPLSVGVERIKYQVLLIFLSWSTRAYLKMLLAYLKDGFRRVSCPVNMFGSILVF